MRFPIRPWGLRSVATRPPGPGAQDRGLEVVAKPKRRQFSAQYRLRIIEEAERCTRRGDLKLASDGLAQGAAQGLAAGVGLEEAGAKPAERNPLDAKVRELEAQVARLQHELHTAHTILDVQGKVPGCWD